MLSHGALESTVALGRHRFGLGWADTVWESAFIAQALGHVESLWVLAQHLFKVDNGRLLHRVEYSLLVLKSLLLRPVVRLVHVAAAPESLFQRDFLLKVRRQRGLLARVVH